MNMQNNFEIPKLFSEHDLHNTFTRVKDYLLINLDFLTDRNYQFQGLNEYFYYIGQQKGLSLVFLQRDGVNLRFTGMLEVIEQTIKELKLTDKTCFFYGYNNYEIKNCTYIKFHVVSKWASLIYNCIRHLPLSQPDMLFRFAGLFGRYDFYRFKLYQHLLNKNSLLSWNTNQIEINHRFHNILEDEIKWANGAEFTSLDYNPNSGSVMFQESLKHIHKHYNNYFIEIVSETDTHNNSFFTEKTLKNFYLGKPFLLFSGPNSLDVLRSYGFRTFEPYIDESYDRCLGSYDRLTTIKKEIDRLALMSDVEIQQLHSNLRPIFEHNRLNFENFINGNKSQHFI